MHGRVACLLFLLSTVASPGEPAVSDDTLGAAQALLLWQVSSNKISPTSSMHYSVSIDGQDLPQPIVEQLRSSTGIVFAPGSMFNRKRTRRSENPGRSISASPHCAPMATTS